MQAALADAERAGLLAVNSDMNTSCTPSMQAEIRSDRRRITFAWLSSYLTQAQKQTMAVLSAFAGTFGVQSLEGVAEVMVALKADPEQIRAVQSASAARALSGLHLIGLLNRPGGAAAAAAGAAAARYSTHPLVRDLAAQIMEGLPAHQQQAAARGFVGWLLYHSQQLRFKLAPGQPGSAQAAMAIIHDEGPNWRGLLSQEHGPINDALTVLASR